MPGEPRALLMERDVFGHTEHERYVASDLRRVTVFRAADGSFYYYAGHEGPFDTESLLGVLIPHDGGWVVLGQLGVSAEPKNVWEALFTLKHLRSAGAGRQLD